MTTPNYTDTAATVLGHVEPGVALSIRHNLAVLRAIHWGAKGVIESDIEFDPREDWWRRPERRFGILFLSGMWRDWPTDPSKHPALERLSVDLCGRLDSLRTNGKITFLGYDYSHQALSKLLAPVRVMAKQLDDRDWLVCRPREWSDYSFAEAVDEFLDRVIKDGFDANENKIRLSMRWWAALGARDVDDLRARQQFFWLDRLLLCTTNAYTTAGAQFFGAIINNTRVGAFRDAVRQWREGVQPTVAKLMGYSRTSDEVEEVSDNNIARELWGFLNLQRGPFFNKQVAPHINRGDDPIPAMLAIGAETTRWLDANPGKRSELAAAFVQWLPLATRNAKQPLAKARRYERKFNSDGEPIDDGAPFDVALNRELNDAGTRLLLDVFGERERAAVMLHLALDATFRPHSVKPGTDGTTVISTQGAGRSAAARLRAAKNVWIYAPGTQAAGFIGDLEHKVARVYWDALPDLQTLASKEELFAELDRHRSEGQASPVNDTATMWAFAREVQVGDVILARQGLRMIVGVGEVTQAYYFTTAAGRGFHRLGVDWFWTGKFSLDSGKQFAMRTFSSGTSRKVLLGELARALDDTPNEPGGDPIPEPLGVPKEPYTIEHACDELFFPRPQVERWKRMLERRRNLVLSGPPGVGKTYVAKRLAKLVTGEDSDERIQMVQFHQAYSYEQFVLGYRPAGSATDKSGNAKPQFELAKGPLFRLAEKAFRDREASFVLIIDEINRGNISRILGEALMLLEADKRDEKWGLELAYECVETEFEQRKFYLPPNLYVIGTMNTADRSLAVVDYALRRRFAFIDVGPRVDSDEFRAHARKQQMPEPVLARLLDRVKELNDKIAADRALGPGFLIGHSFFTINEPHTPWQPEGGSSVDAETLAHEWLDDVFECELEPLLSEYWAESPEQFKAAHALIWKGRTNR